MKGSAEKLGSYSYTSRWWTHKKKKGKRTNQSIILDDEELKNKLATTKEIDLIHSQEEPKNERRGSGRRLESFDGG